MSLTPGERIGAYEVIAPIGAGGMGEVYRARDTTLKRDVALKLLPELFAQDPGRLARFQREAEVLASLNHSNIAHIYGVAESENTRALVMELAEGESPKGPMPLEDAWKTMAQIAEALEYAHEKGVVHRDLKPANIKVTPDGVVKLLDFGLAKAFTGTPQAGPHDPENSPTITMGATVAGTILGTAAYMSPEQARGRNVDKRADIWTFGVVLYELLTGVRLFAGGDAMETLGAVIHKEPDLSAVPEKARPLLRACLEKDPKKRLRDIGDAPRLLSQSAAPAAARGGFNWGWAAAGVLGIAAAALALVHSGGTSPAADVMRFTVSLPSSVVPGFLAISPDGRKLAIGTAFLGKSTMYVRTMDSTEAVSLEGTELARSPFWSPDSRFIGFFAPEKLKTIPAAGGPATTLCGDTGLAGGGTWSRAGVILFAGDGKLRRVNAAGGECAAVDLGGLEVTMPQFLPDGNHFLFLGEKGGDADSEGLYLASLDGMKPRKILNGRSSGLYAAPVLGKGPAHLLFLRGASLMAQAFDAEKLEPIGDPVAIPAQGSMSDSPPQVAASVSSNGTLVYLNGVQVRQQLTWFDRSGKELATLGQAASRGGVALSPDGTRALAGEGGLAMYDLIRNLHSSVTPSDQPGRAGVWSPDGTRVIYTLNDGGHGALFLRPVNGGGQATRVLPTDGKDRYASDWSRDGKYLIYTESEQKDRGDLWYLPDPGKADSKPVRFVATPGIDTQGQLSPDGRWLAYYSTEGNAGNLYLRAFPSGEPGMKVAEVGFEPRWSKSGKELYYLTRGELGGQAALMAVTVQEAGGGALPKLGAPQKIMDFPAYIIVPQINAFTYSVDPDGKRFLVNVDTREEKREISVITNWEKLIPGGSK